MSQNISPLLSNVNKHAVLTENKHIYKFAYMKYGKRLKLARGEMTQTKLAELSGVNQSLISQLENSDTATGSEYTPRLARTLGISVDWLADEIGEMIPTRYSTSDPKIVAMCLAMEPTPEYVKDAAVKAVLSACELAARAKANGINS